MSIDLTALRDELANDPDALGYAGQSDADVQRIINQRRAAYSVFRTAIPMGEVYGAVDWVNEWLSLEAVRREGFRQLTSTDFLDASSTNVRAAIEAIFGTGSTTWANLASLASRDASRAEALWGAGTRVTVDEITAARSL